MIKIKWSESGSTNANIRNYSAEIAVPVQLNSVTVWIQLKFILNSGWNSEHGLWISGTPLLPEQMSRFSWNLGPAWLACVHVTVKSHYSRYPLGWRVFVGGKSFQVPCFETPARVPFFSRGGASKLYFACRPLSLLLTCSECPPPALISCCWDTLSVVPLIDFPY